MKLSNCIRKLRFEYDEMTQKQLAELVGVSRQTINAIENSKYAPRIDVAIRIADVFDICVDQLFGRNCEGKPKHLPIETKAPITHESPSIEIAADDNAGHEAAEKPAKSEVSLADLRGML